MIDPQAPEGQAPPTEQADPFAARPGPAETAFRRQRWERAGADDADLAELRDAHGRLAPNQQAFEAAAIDATSDNELTEVLAAMRDRGEYGALTTSQRPGDPAAPPEEPPADTAGAGTARDDDTRSGAEDERGL